MGSLKTRVKNKVAPDQNWINTNPVLLKGEIAFSEKDSILRMKVGDGVKTYTQLPFTDEPIRSLITDIDTNKTSVVMTENGTPTPLDVFNIIKLTQTEYEELIANGTVDPDALYLTDSEGEASGGGGSSQFITVTEQTDLNTLVEPGYYIGESSLFLNGPAETTTEVLGETLVIVGKESSRAGMLTNYAIIQTFIKAGKIYHRSTSKNGAYPTDFLGGWGTTTVWETYIIEGSNATLSSLDIKSTTASTSTTTGALKVAGGVGVAGDLYANKVYGSVWNDYAECRISDKFIEPGRVVRENGDDTVSLADDRGIYGCSIVSDTFGFMIGETEKAKTPLAVSGRVLAYPYEDREIFRKNIGHFVCSGPNGTVSIMDKEEVLNHPEAIIGTISAVPDYEVWSDVKVDGRVWIKVR